MPGETLAHAVVDGPADLSLVEAVHDALESLWARVPEVGDEDRMMFALAVSEVATNVVEHAEGPEVPHVRVRLEVDAEWLTAVMADDADPALIRLHEVSMPGADAESGRGLAIALAVLDDLVHETDEGNTWRLRRRRRDETSG